MKRLLLFAPPRAVVPVLLLVPALSIAATIRVDWSGGGDFATIQAGLDAAAFGDTVLVAPGTYVGEDNRDLEFAGKRLVLRSEQGPGSTVIDCARYGRAFYFHAGEDYLTTVSGFTITRGWMDEGGAVLLHSSGPLIENCVFTNNLSGYGGAIHAAQGSAPQIVDCKFSGNEAEFYGGAVYSHSSSPYIAGCEFEGNEAVISGGGMSLKTGTVARVYDCSFSGNTAADGGGAYVGVFESEPPGRDIPDASIFNNCRFYDNTATRGAGLFVNSFSWTLCAYTFFAGNSATEGGGIFVFTEAGPTLSVQNCTIALNEAFHGGGIFVTGFDDEFQPSVTTSIIAFNTEGEAIFREWGAPVNVNYACAYGNAGGDEIIGVNILYEDPLFCDMLGDDFRLCSNSSCRQVNNPWHFLFGASSFYCGTCSSGVEETSWGSIKAMFR